MTRVNAYGLNTIHLEILQVLSRAANPNFTSREIYSEMKVSMDFHALHRPLVTLIKANYITRKPGRGMEDYYSMSDDQKKFARKVLKDCSLLLTKTSSV